MSSSFSPGEKFNFAAFLVGRNAARAQRMAYRDDSRTLSYGALHDGIRRCASGDAASQRADRIQCRR